METELILYKLQKYKDKLAQNSQNIIYQQKIDFYLNELEGGGGWGEAKQKIDNEFKNICVQILIDTKKSEQPISGHSQEIVDYNIRYSYDYLYLLNLLINKIKLINTVKFNYNKIIIRNKLGDFIIFLSTYPIIKNTPLYVYASQIRGIINSYIGKLNMIN